MPRASTGRPSLAGLAWRLARDGAQRGPGVAAQRPVTVDLGVRTGLRRPDQQRPVRRGEHADDAQHARAGADRRPGPSCDSRSWREPGARLVPTAAAQGANVIGWAAGLTLAGAGSLSGRGLPTLDEALLEAARAIRTTGRPVGLLVWRGRHAWVMSGFRATADPSVKGARVTAAIVEDPLYPHGSKVWGPSPAPGEALSVKEVGRQFVRRGNNSWGTRETAGMYVLVLPYELDAPTLDRPVGSPRSGRPADVHGPRLSKDHSPRSRRPGLRLQLGPVVEDSING